MAQKSHEDKVEKPSKDGSTAPVVKEEGLGIRISKPQGKDRKNKVGQIQFRGDKVKYCLFPFASEIFKLLILQYFLSFGILVILSKILIILDMEKYILK